MPKVCNWVILVVVVAVAVFALVTPEGTNFPGTDTLAKEAINQIRPHYRPWFSPVWEPPGGAMESLLFALQAALGAGFIGFYFGYLYGRRRAGHGGRS